ncbi:hypothetical protein L195_g061939, partial [Trifolium pratense]
KEQHKHSKHQTVGPVDYGEEPVVNSTIPVTKHAQQATAVPSKSTAIEEASPVTTRLVSLTVTIFR